MKFANTLLNTLFENGRKVDCNLQSVDSNSFNLMGLWRSKAREQGWTKEEMDAVVEECISGSRDHLLMTLVAFTGKKEKKVSPAQKQVFATFSFEEIKDLDDRFGGLVDELVPDSGISETLEGEIVRAFSRIEYRYYNDGDYYDKDYGIETVSPSMDWLMDCSPLGGKIEEIYKTNSHSCDEDYENMLRIMQKVIVEFVESKEGHYTENKEDSRSYNREGKSYIQEWEEEEEWEDIVTGKQIGRAHV